MPRKAFLVQVELHVHAVTCPGVWLCPNGKISLQIHMLGSSIQTRCAEPTFPIVFDEKFVFSRSYCDVGRLGTLQKIFNKDTLYIELIQWQNCENGNVLATFQTTLAELLYPESKKQCMGNAEVDLLMEPMKNFPGILAPKIEVTTKTTIQDEICPTSDEDLTCPDAPVVGNPNVVASHQKALQGRACAEHAPFARQKPVCHTKRCHLAKCANLQSSGAGIVDKRPPFVVRKVPDDLKYYCSCKDCRDERCEERSLALRTSKSREPREVETRNSTVRRVTRQVNPEGCCGRQAGVNRQTSPVRWSSDPTPPVCSCGDKHSDNCLVCAKYKHYFESRSIKSHKRQENKVAHDCPCYLVEAHAEERSDPALCNYTTGGQYRQPTMAQKLHARLSETLSRCVNCQQTMNTDCDCGDCIRDSPDCATGSLSQFYKKLYTCNNKCP